jgi:hypothetical protein
VNYTIVVDLGLTPIVSTNIHVQSLTQVVDQLESGL